jgi:methylenetetrahydrofolate reductase (NADPH)
VPASSALSIGDDPKRRIIEFATGASTEITSHDAGAIPELAAILPLGSVVYVAHTPKATLAEVVETAVRVEAAGLAASPHIVARRIQDAESLRDAARRLGDAGVERALVVAGDLQAPAGPYAISLDVLESGILANAGVTRIGVAAHPEGHRSVDTATLWDALRAKQAHAERAGIDMHLVTQFGFDATAIGRWGRELRQRGIRLPVHVGMAGPAPLAKLVKYAMACGVGASLRGALRSLQTVRHVAGLATTPEAMLANLARDDSTGPGRQLRHPHLFAFGGVVATARWLRALLDGRFEVDSEYRLEIQA